MDKILTMLAEELAKYSSIEKAVLFGSRARGDNDERSDYDIAVFGELSHADKAKLRTLTDDGLPTLHKIDLVFVNEIANVALMDNIQREGVRFYGKVK